jgi:hypothetical protein
MPPRVKKQATADKKKTKMPIQVVATITPDGIQGSFTPEIRRPLIAQLRVHSKDVNFTEVHTETPHEPEPYDAMNSNVFEELQEVVDMKPDIITRSEIPKTDEYKPMPCYSNVNLMMQYRNTSIAKTLPLDVDIACFWCAHKFKGMPCVIPEREVTGIFYVYGNFCCPECSLAYLLNETIDPHVRWERIALLHRIYDPNGEHRLFPAPSREALQLFGGPLSIESFRETIRGGKVRIDLHMPPMVSILGSIDTKPIDFFDTNIKHGNMGGAFLQENTKRAEEGLRLKRSKPLKDRDSTLDSVMNIHIRSHAI